MPILPPVLDDRRFEDLVNELLARVPAHTPEWTNPRPGDPGQTLIELFAWLTDTLLYRVNHIPVRQRLTFLRLLGEQMRPAIPARTVVNLFIDDENETNAFTVRAGATVKGQRPVTFETTSEITVLPVSAEAYYKREPAEGEIPNLEAVLAGLREIYKTKISTNEEARAYVTTPVFPGGEPEVGGFDIMTRTVDKCLWLALLAAKPEHVAAVRETLGSNESGGHRLLNVGVLPSITVPTLPELDVPGLSEGVGPRARIPHVWEITSVGTNGRATVYHQLDQVVDGTSGLTRRGVQRLALPAKDFINAVTSDVRQVVEAGVGDEPPRLDDPEKVQRLVAWLRLRPNTPRNLPLHRMDLSWVGINTVEIDQRQTVIRRVIGRSSGLADQEFKLPNKPGESVERESLKVQVEEAEVGFQQWRRTDDHRLEDRDARAYSLDSEAGVIRFGNNVHSQIPELGNRIRVAEMRAGGGRAGNLPPWSLSDISNHTGPDGKSVAAKLKVMQPLLTDGGEDAETLENAEQRIPAEFRHGHRAVTEEDFQRLVPETPGVAVGRVEVLPRFKPQQRQDDIPGIVSVMVLPAKSEIRPPDPRPDRPFLEAVYGHLDVRRTLATELYVIGCEYVPLGVSVSVTISNGSRQEEVLLNVREALRQYLWPLAPGGPQSNGWPLGRRVNDRELEVVVARVEGVVGVNGVNLFQKQDDQWAIVPRSPATAPVNTEYQRWQLPELLTVVATATTLAAESAGIGPYPPPDNLDQAPNPFAEESAIAVPVVPEVCR